MAQKKHFSNEKDPLGHVIIHVILSHLSLTPKALQFKNIHFWHFAHVKILPTDCYFQNMIIRVN